MGRGQTALEYLLMIAGGVLLSAIMMVVVNNNLNLAAGEISSSEYASRVHNYLSTTIETNDGDWIIVGSNQYSGVPGNVGIGTTSPQAKLEVNGKIMMDDATAASDSANTVATKGYVDGKSSAQTWNASGGNQYSLVSGNVGIGTTSPQAKLSVNGTTTINGTVDVSNNIITGLAAPINETDAVNKAYVDAASGSTGGNTTVIFNSTLNVGMPLQGIIDYNGFPSYPVNTIPLSLPADNCGVKITVCNTAPTKLILGADPVARIVVPNIHHSTINEVGPTTSGTRANTIQATAGGSGPACGESTGSPRIAYCQAGYTCAVYPMPYYYNGGNIGGGPGTCCAPGLSYDSTLNICYSCPSGTTWSNILGACYTCPSGYVLDTTSRVCYTGPNTAANRCPAASAGEVFLRWENTASSRTCTYYNSVAYTDSAKKFIMEETDSYVYCPTDHPTYDPISKNCIRDATVSTNLIGTRCSTFSTYLNTAFTDVTFRNDAGAYVDAYNVKVAYNCPTG